MTHTRSKLTRNILGNWKLKYSCRIACVSNTAFLYWSDAVETRARISSSCRWILWKICQMSGFLSHLSVAVWPTLPGFLPLSRRPPLATALPMTRFPPEPPDRLWTPVSLNDSPSFWSKTRSSSSEVVSSRFFHFSVVDSESWSARSYRIANSFVWCSSLVAALRQIVLWTQLVFCSSQLLLLV